MASAIDETSGGIEPHPPHGLFGRTASMAIELIGIVALGTTIVLDTVSRFVLEDQSLFRAANAFAVLAALCAVLDALATASAYRRHPHAFGIHLVADVAAAVLILVSVTLRVRYWEADQGTPIRAIIPTALAFVLIGVATWTNVTDRSEQALAAADAA